MPLQLCRLCPCFLVGSATDGLCRFCRRHPNAPAVDHSSVCLECGNCICPDHSDEQCIIYNICFRCLNAAQFANLDDDDTESLGDYYDDDMDDDDEPQVSMSTDIYIPRYLRDIPHTPPAPAPARNLTLTPDTLPVDDESVCSICLVKYVENTSARVRLQCNPLHRFHRACITPWLQRSSSCPLCRRCE